MPTARPNRVQSVQRAIAILKTFSDEDLEIGVSEIARRVGLNKSIAMRLINTLRHEGFLEQDPASTKYRIGLGLFETGTLYHLHASMRRHAEPLLQDLAEQLRMSAYLGTLSDGRVAYILAIEGPGPIRVGPRLGSSTPAHTTAAGKALLAYLAQLALEQYLITQELHPETPHSITSRDTLRRELARIRAQGYSVTRGEHLQGVSAVGSPVFDRHGRAIAAVSVAFPSALVRDSQLSRIAVGVVQTAEKISRRLGHREVVTDSLAIPARA